MVWSAPLWLLLLLPWIAAAIWALRGRAETRPVTHLPLWDRSAVVRTRTRSRRLPPLRLVTLLAATLSAIFGAAGPGLVSSSAGRVTVIVDRNLSTVAPLRQSPIAVADVFGRETDGPVTRIDVPGTDPIETDRTAVAASLSSVRPTAVETADLLAEVVARRQRAGDRAIVVVTAGAFEAAGVRRVAPKSVRNAGIEHFAVRGGPPARAMIRVWNDTESTEATLTVDGVAESITLPPRGQAKNYFLDLPVLGLTSTATLELADDVPEDNVAFVARQSVRPRFENRSPLPAGVERMTRLYAAQYPPGGGAVVAIGREPLNLRSDQAAVRIGVTESGEVDTAKLQIDAAHPLCRDVDWPRVLRGALSVGIDVPPDARVLIRDDNAVLLAEAAEPSRQIYIGFDAPDWPSRPDFVVFWTNVFDRFTGGPSQPAAVPSESVLTTWTRQQGPTWIDAGPGLYDSPRGMVAVATRVARPSLAVTSGELPDDRIDRARPLAPWLLTFAAALVALGAVLSRRTAVAPA